MENLFRYIKVKALAWIENEGKIFVVRMSDSVKGDQFYRSIGGSVEYGETAREAVKREAMEELNAEIEVSGEPLVLENLFIHEGKNGHEINFVFTCRFLDRRFYEDKVYNLIEANGEEFDAMWVPMEDCLSGKLRLVPEQLHEWYKASH
jgi:8-oxo-dGTP pyrophosphatase MutT (NUDIX family)